MHVSKYRFGPGTPAERHDWPAEPRPVRVRYFDPRTGEPCDTKPEPLKSDRTGIDVFERDAKRAKDEKEAAEIMRSMKERKNAEQKAKAEARRKSGGNRKPVLVDGVLFKTSDAAAREIGTTPAYISTVLNNGGGMCKGRTIKFAEEGK